MSDVMEFEDAPEALTEAEQREAATWDETYQLQEAFLAAHSAYHDAAWNYANTKQSGAVGAPVLREMGATTIALFNRANELKMWFGLAVVNARGTCH